MSKNIHIINIDSLEYGEGGRVSFISKVYEFRELWPKTSVFVIIDHKPCGNSGHGCPLMI